jgi:hypothetical protein
MKISPVPTFTRLHVPGTEGPLKISIGGMTGEFPVTIDNISVGFVSAEKPLSMMMLEDNYTVKVCCGKICKQEIVEVKFGKQRTVDLSEQFKRDLGSSGPDVRILDYFLSGDQQLTIDVEFLNPTTQPKTMSADVTCRYSYIDRQNYNRVQNVAQSFQYTTVNACDRVTKIITFDLDYGSDLIYDVPQIRTVEINPR